MKMIAVGWIEIGAERDAEIAAGLAMDLAKKAPFWTLVIPMPKHTYACSIGEFETGYVNRIGRGVLASQILPHGIANNIAAIIGAIILDGGHG